MIKPNKLKRGDKVAIVSLSNGMLGEPFCKHNIEIGVRRLADMGLNPVFMKNALKGIEYLEQYPEKRAEDLKAAFMDDEIKGIICAIGGEDTYRTLPYLMEDQEFLEQVKKHPKLFTGFSDTTINHLMFYKIGIQSYYGPAFICDIAEIADKMLPYTKEAFMWYMAEENEYIIRPSDIWYEERKDFSADAIGTEHISHKEENGFELLQGNGTFEGQLIGGCLESIYDILSLNRFPDEKEVCERYHIFPDRNEWEGKILFIETCEEKPTPQELKKELNAIKEKGVFDVISGVIIGKPQDQQYYEEYKGVYREVIENPQLPVLYNVNFGHALPRTVIPYGAMAKVDASRQMIIIENVMEEQR